jgi:hypothetical protein
VIGVIAQLECLTALCRGIIPFLLEHRIACFQILANDCWASRLCLLLLPLANETRPSFATTFLMSSVIVKDRRQNQPDHFRIVTSRNRTGKNRLRSLYLTGKAKTTQINFGKTGYATIKTGLMSTNN